MAAVRAAVTEGELSVPVPEEAPLSWANAGSCGSPLALRLAGAAGRPAPEVAAIIVRRLGALPGVGEVTVTGPGFITIAERDAGALVEQIVETADSYGVRGVPRPERGWPDRPRTFENPGFSVRFAYARAAAVRRRAGDLGVTPWKACGLDAPEEIALLGLLGEFPGRADLAVRKQSAGPLERHLERTAEAYHDVYERCPALPVGDQAADAAHGARVALAGAVEITLRNGLLMLGENPRERL